MLSKCNFIMLGFCYRVVKRLIQFDIFDNEGNKYEWRLLSGRVCLV